MCPLGNRGGTWETIKVRTDSFSLSWVDPQLKGWAEPPSLNSWNPKRGFSFNLLFQLQWTFMVFILSREGKPPFWIQIIQRWRFHWTWSDFVLKHVTQKLQADSISANSASTSGSSENLKIKTSNSIGFRYRRAKVSWLVSFDCIFLMWFWNEFFCFEIFSKKKCLWKDRLKFSTLECNVPDSNLYNLWNRHSWIKPETNFQLNQKTL